MGPERDWRTGRMEVLPPAGMREAKMLRGCSNAVGGAIAGQLGQKLVVLGGEASLFLLQRRDLVALCEWCQEQQLRAVRVLQCPGFL